MKIFVAATCLFFALAFVSCKKDAVQTPQPTKTELMTTSAWKVEDAGFDAEKDGTISTSLFSSLPPCLIDNSLTFKTDNSGITDEGAAKCNTTDPQTTNFNWSFADAEANINISNSVLGQMNGKSKVVVLSATNLTLAKDTTIFGFSGWAVVKLKH